MEDNKFIREYDEKGRLTHTRYSDGREVWWEYDEKGNITHYKDSDGYEVWKEYDEKGNVAHCKNSDGYDESFFKTKAEEYYELIFNHYDSVDDLANLLNEMYNLGKEEYLYERTDDNY